jgi:YHS domain-containing protein
MEVRRFVITLIVGVLYLCTSMMPIPRSDPAEPHQERAGSQEWAYHLKEAIGPALVFAGSETENAQKLCPVMGGKIDKTAYVDYQGKRVYFCCAGCKDAFLKEPDKHVKAMEAKGIELAMTPGD